MLRIFCIGFTKKRPNQIKRTCYAQSSQIRQVFVSTLSSGPYTIWVSGWPIYLANVVCSGVHHSDVGASFSFWGARSGERWVKSWCVKPKVVTWRSWWPSLFQRWSERKLRRRHLVSILSRILTSAKWRFWKLPSLTLLSLWRWVCFTFYHTFLYLDIDIFCKFSWMSPKGPSWCHDWVSQLLPKIWQNIKISYNNLPEIVAWYISRHIYTHYCWDISVIFVNLFCWGISTFLMI